MHFLYAVSIIAANAAIAAAQACTTPSGSGTCLATSSCGTFTVAGYCPGSTTYQCCVQQSCTAGGGSGTCKSTSQPCSGSYYSGACPGPSTVQCCVASSSTSDLKAIDISQSMSASFWSCVAANYQKVVIRGYSQACGSGGAVDSKFVGSYNAARAAGVSRIDAYLFPCTGTQPTGVACKSPATQLNEFKAVISNNGMVLDRVWFDVEPTSGVCNAWNLGASANLALAKQWTALLRTSGLKFGIYANGNQWTSMFATRSTDIGSDLPLWAVQDDFKPGVSTVTTFMGGWTSAFAKQYNLDTTSCGGSVDLDSFRP